MALYLLRTHSKKNDPISTTTHIIPIECKILENIEGMGKFLNERSKDKK